MCGTATRAVLGRHTLKSLLINEEDKFGGYSEKFDQVERKIADSHQHIVSQHKIIDRLKANGSDCIAAEWALANLVDILDTCRAKLQIVVERRSSMGFHCIEE